MMQNVFHIDRIIRRALEEDLGTGDVTTETIVDPNRKGQASLLAKQDFILSGIHVFARTFALLDATVTCHFHCRDGEQVQNQKSILEISGSTSAMLKAERTALNFLQRMSGIATLTRHYTDKVKKYGTKILDTRKTAPGLRLLDKYAVRTGGGHNHRLSLADGVLIKDNHIVAAGSIQKAVELVKQKAPHMLKIEVEIQKVEQIEEAIAAGSDILMLDNFTLEQMAQAVRQVTKRIPLEVSGNVNLDTVEAIAATGVDFISIGALTHSVKAVDISLELMNA